MKKIKLMLVALFAMVSTVVFGQDVYYATTTFRYHLVDGEGTTKLAVIDGFVADYATTSMATVIIPNQVTDPVDATKKYDVSDIAWNAFNENANIKKVQIEATKLTSLSTAFAKCANLAEVDFTKATGLIEIWEGAFDGTKIGTLNLSATKLVQVNNLFGTHYKQTVAYGEVGANAYNAKLEGAVKAGDVQTEAVLYDEAGAAAANAEKCIEYVEGKHFGDEGCLTAAQYNEAVEGASVETGDGISEARVAAYNEAVTVAEGDVKVAAVLYTNETAAAYNATLEGAKAATDTYVADAVANTTLTSVTLPETWTSIVANAFVNCTALQTINFGTAKADQTIGEAAFLGTGLKALDFTGTKVSGILPANLLIDGVNVKKNESLATVTLIEGITGLNGNFAFCTKLAAINLTNIAYANFAEGEFEGCSTLKEITIPATYASIPASAFKDCTALATVTFAKPAEGAPYAFTLIGEYAFANTALANFTVPSVMPYTDAADQDLVATTYDEESAALANAAMVEVDGVIPGDFAAVVGRPADVDSNEGRLTEEDADDYNEAMGLPVAAGDVIAYGVAAGVMRNAFADCAKLKSFTYKPTIGEDPVAKVVSDKAFLGCEDGITFYTVKEYAEAATGANKVAPTHSTFSYETSPAAPEEEEDAKVLTAVKFKNGNNKYFVKYNSMTENIKIAKTDAKVYAAYNADDDATIVMQQFKTNGGYYHIAAGDNVIIITDLEKVPYETSGVVGGSTVTDGVITAVGKGSSWLNSAADEVARENMLNYITAEGGVKRSVLEGDLPGAGYYIFAWSNTTKATGWLKITSGSTFPQKTLYIYAKPTEAAAGARVIWLDENGFVEDETTAIQSISTQSENEDGAIYNVAGQKVNASYKGLVIKNGKKYMK